MKFTFEDGYTEEKPLGAAICGYQRKGKRPIHLLISQEELDRFKLEHISADWISRYLDKLPATLGFNGTIEVVPLYLQDPDTWYIKENGS